jgi:hypothetical protein
VDSPRARGENSCARCKGPRYPARWNPHVPVALTVGAPEASTWAMMLLGFASLGFAGYRADDRICLSSVINPRQEQQRRQCAAALRRC